MSPVCLFGISRLNHTATTLNLKSDVDMTIDASLGSINSRSWDA